MGIFKVLYSTVRNACQKLYNLGCAVVRKIWPAGVSEALHSATEKLTQTVTNTCRSSYELCCAAVGKVNNAVRVVQEQIPKEYLPDSHEWEKFQQILMEIAKYGADVAIRKFLKGYTIWLDVYSIIIRVGLKPRRPSDHGNKKSKCSWDEENMDQGVRKEKDKMQEQMNNINYHIKILREQIQILLEWIKPHQFPNEKVLLESVQKLEDVTSPCMREGFKGGD